MKIDKTKCIGCNGCASLFPEVFEMKDGKAQVKKNPKKVNIQDAIDICTPGAIK